MRDLRLLWAVWPWRYWGTLRYLWLWVWLDWSTWLALDVAGILVLLLAEDVAKEAHVEYARCELLTIVVILTSDGDIL